MNYRFNPSDDPPTEERECSICGEKFQEMMRDPSDKALALPTDRRRAALCIKCDPAAEDRDYRVVVKVYLV